MRKFGDVGVRGTNLKLAVSYVTHMLPVDIIYKVRFAVMLVHFSDVVRMRGRRYLSWPSALTLEGKHRNSSSSAEILISTLMIDFD